MNEKKKNGKVLEMREEKPADKPIFSQKVKKEIREWIVSLTTALVVVMLVSNFLVTIIRVDGGSMLNTLHDGDRLLVNVLDMQLNGPERYDVVILHYPQRKGNFVKRIIGMPGDTLEVKQGVLYINGEAVEEEYLAEERTVKFHSDSYHFGPIEIPEDQYFVLGDHRDKSNDSRQVGLIDRDLLVGQASYIFWPLDRLGAIE